MLLLKVKFRTFSSDSKCLGIRSKFLTFINHNPASSLKKSYIEQRYGRRKCCYRSSHCTTTYSIVSHAFVPTHILVLSQQKSEGKVMSSRHLIDPPHKCIYTREVKTGKVNLAFKPANTISRGGEMQWVIIYAEQIIFNAFIFPWKIPNYSGPNHSPPPSTFKINI